jgi:CHAT domain-containing protein
MTEMRGLISPAGFIRARMAEGGRDLHDEPLNPVLERFSVDLLGPLWEELRERPRWILALDGDLAMLPIAALPRPDGRGYVHEEFEVSYVSSGRDVLAFGKRPPSRGGALILANPDFETAGRASGGSAAFDGDVDASLTRAMEGAWFGPLPGTRREAESIASMMEAAGVKVTLFTGPNADKANLLAAESPRFLHLATHGYFLDSRRMGLESDPFVVKRTYVDDYGRVSKEALPPLDPMLFSGLALAGANRRDSRVNGLATAFELEGMNLAGTQLVVLSACETGLGGATTGAGVIGLQRSLRRSGAGAIVVSLWDVPDEETSQLMEKFYARVLKGTRPAAALREAMMELRVEREEAGKDARPFYWGAFVLVGDPG